MAGLEWLQEKASRVYSCFASSADTYTQLPVIIIIIILFFLNPGKNEGGKKLGKVERGLKWILLLLSLNTGKVKKSILDPDPDQSQNAIHCSLSRILPTPLKNSWTNTHNFPSNILFIV